MKLIINRVKKNKTILALTVVIFVTITSSLVVFSSKNIDSQKRVPSYDENMWTNIGIASYTMFNGYQRKNILNDSWFLQYAYQEKLDIFKPSKDNKSVVVDHSKIPLKTYQWYDRTLWTFGWKAPNLSKLIKGWYINYKNKNVNPAGYYALGIAENNEDPRLYYSSGVPKKFVEDARHTDAFFSLLSLLLVFIIGYKFFSFTVGSLSWLYLILNDNYIQVTTAAGMDSTLFFFSLLTIFLFLYLFTQLWDKELALKKLALLTAFLGITMGFLISSKFNGATLFYEAIILAISYLYILWKNFPKKEKINRKKKIQKRYSDELYKERTNYLFKWIKKTSVMAVVVFITSMGVFLYLNPQLRNDTSKKISIIRASVDAFFELRAKAKNTTHIKNEFKESAKLVISTLYFSTNPKQGFIGTIGNHIPIKWKFLDAFFLLTGLFVLFRKSKDAIIKQKKITSEYIIFTSFLVIFYMNTDFIWINYSRYFTPFQIVGIFVIAMGIEKCIIFVKECIIFVKECIIFVKEKINKPKKA